MKAAFPVAFGALLSCAQTRTEPAEPFIAPAGDSALATPSASAASLADASAAAFPTALAAPSCNATKAFSPLHGTEHAQLPVGAPGTICDALSAVFNDYDSASESSATAGGTVRAGESFPVEHAARTLWVVPYYTGTSAEESFLCGCCEAAANLALLTASQGKLVVAAKTTQPIEHRGMGTGITSSPLKLALDERRELVLVESAHTCGNAPLRRYLHGLVLDGDKLGGARSAGGEPSPPWQLVEVLDWRVGARGSTAGADVSELTATVTTQAGPGPERDLVFTWSRKLCPFDEQAGEYVCGSPKPAGTERLRWSGTDYERRGPEAKLEHFSLP
jgi:hypothetical protein